MIKRSALLMHRDESANHQDDSSVSVNRNKSPRRDHRSPHRRSRSPRRYERSPRRYERSPRRYERSPRRYERSPKRHERSPRRQDPSPSRYTSYDRSPRRYKSPSQHYRYRSPSPYSYHSRRSDTRPAALIVTGSSYRESSKGQAHKNVPNPYISADLTPSVPSVPARCDFLMETSSADQTIQSQLNNLPDLSTHTASAVISQADESENEDEYILASDRENQGRFAELLPVIREFFPEAKIETTVPTSHLSMAQKFMENTSESIGRERLPLSSTFPDFLSRYLLIVQGINKEDKQRKKFPVGQYPRPPKVKDFYTPGTDLGHSRDLPPEWERLLSKPSDKDVSHILINLKDFRQFRRQQDYAMSVQSHIEWMLLSAAKSILHIMSNQSGEDTATEEALSLTQRLLLSACRGLTDLGTSTAWMNSNFILRERDAYLKKISSNVIQSDIQSLREAPALQHFLFDESTVNKVKDNLHSDLQASVSTMALSMSTKQSDFPRFITNPSFWHRDLSQDVCL